MRDKAAKLQRRFDEAFWDEEGGFYAYCLDGEKKKILTVASNPGHLLWSGIVPKAKAARVVERLLRPDMWSGWGIRTLSADHPSFNPHSYQNGSVWPHDNGLIAIGFKRYGFHAEAARIARDISGACSYFMLHQMPELFAGLAREADELSRSVPRRQRSPGLGGGQRVRAAAGDHRVSAARRRGRALSRSLAAVLASRPDVTGSPRRRPDLRPPHRG